MKTFQFSTIPSLLTMTNFKEHVSQIFAVGGRNGCEFDSDPRPEKSTGEYLHSLHDRQRVAYLATS